VDARGEQARLAASHWSTTGFSGSSIDGIRQRR
jgi:hypothetical protein